MALPCTREYRSGRKNRSGNTTFAYPATAVKQTPLKTLTPTPPPNVFQDRWSELGLVSQIAFKVLLNLDHGTHGKDFLTHAISLKLVFASI